MLARLTTRTTRLSHAVRRIIRHRDFLPAAITTIVMGTLTALFARDALDAFHAVLAFLFTQIGHIL